MDTKKALIAGMAMGAAVAAVSFAITAMDLKNEVKNKMKWWRGAKLLKKLRAECDTSVSKLRTIAGAIAREMEAGMETEDRSTIKMIPSYLCAPPGEGTETGVFYGLDFGGTNYRIMKFELQNGSGLIVSKEKKLIPGYVKRGTFEVFDFIALELKKFIESNEKIPSESGVRELGFSFSFPVRQNTMSTGSLIRWTKGFAVCDGVGKDIVDCLEQAMSKIGLKMSIAALVNDTVSTFCFGHYQNKDTVAAVVIGTGTNACYMEKVSAITKRPGLPTTSGEMIVNVEWGNFYSDHLPRTPYDESLDADSSNPKEQVFEKMISGMYLGEIVRRMVLRMLQELDMELISDRLSTPFTLACDSVAIMNQDDSPNLDKIEQVFRDVFEIKEVPLYLRRLVVGICDIVARRSAGLVAAGIVGILQKLKQKDQGVASQRNKVVVLDGGVYNGYTLFRKYLMKALEDILGDEARMYIFLSSMDCGPVVGAALIAASCSNISDVDSQLQPAQVEKDSVGEQSP